MSASCFASEKKQDIISPIFKKKFRFSIQKVNTMSRKTFSTADNEGINPFYTRLIFILFFFSSSSVVFGQQLWKKSTENTKNSFAEKNSAAIPTDFGLFELNKEILNQKLSGVRQLAPGATTVSFDFPMPDGTYKQGLVYESSILSPKTQALIPHVKTYLIADPTTGSGIGRVTIYDNSITGILFSDRGNVYISPVDNEVNRTHIVYFVKDLNLPFPITCGVKDENSSPLPSTQNLIEAGDGNLRTYRLAVAATGEYTTTWAGSQAQALTYITICINVVNAIYERDATIRFILVTNNSILYTDAATDPYTGTLNSAEITANNTFTNTNLGAGNYDVGIVFNNGYSGGLAQLNSVCTANKGRAGAGITFGFGVNPTQGPQGPGFDATVAHEIAHQFSATHTMAASNGSCGANATLSTAWEPGGGSTIMAYAGTCTGNFYQANNDLYFHTGNVAQISNYATTLAGNTCPVITNPGNAIPTVTVAAPAYTIPISTPFFLTCGTSDANGNALTYTWEQMDAPAATTATPPVATDITGPNFRSFPPSANTTRYLPNIPAVVNGFSTAYEVLSSVDRTMNFRVNVRDNAAGNGANAQANIAVTTSTASAAFTVTSQSAPTSLTANGTNTLTITWNVGSTTSAPFNTANVSILFSADGGNNFNYILAPSTANDGSHIVVVPNINTSAGRIMIRSIGNIFYNINAANITITSGCAAEGAQVQPASTVSAGAGSPALNLGLSPNFGSAVFPTSGASLTTSDPSSSLAIFSTVTSSCQNFTGNLFRYDIYPFQVSVAGNYTFNRSPAGAVYNIYAGDFNPLGPCGNFLASNGSYDGTTPSTTAALTANLLPGINYNLVIGTFSSASPALPYSYTVSVTGTPVGGGVFSGYLNPGGTYSYRYAIVDNSTGNIKQISTTANLSNNTTYPAGTYTVYGFSYLISHFSAGTLTAYEGGPFSTFLNDLNNLPASRCGNISKNSVTVNVLTVLPLRLLPLTGLWDGGQVKLFWSSEDEKDVSKFEIEKSIDGQNFITLKGVQAAGNTNYRTNYTAVDDSPGGDRIFYRVKAIDTDGRFKYSNTVMVSRTFTSMDVNVYPNPVTGSATIEILSAENTTAYLEVIDAAGRRTVTSSILLRKGINIHTINLENKATGIYHLKLSSGNHTFSKKIIKQ
jgi:Metallo-peptidase family M12B Reprolysin-like/Secretion system C-terminal sorting domain